MFKDSLKLVEIVIKTKKIAQELLVDKITNK